MVTRKTPPKSKKAKTSIEAEIERKKKMKEPGTLSIIDDTHVPTKEQKEKIAEWAKKHSSNSVHDVLHMTVAKCECGVIPEPHHHIDSNTVIPVTEFIRAITAYIEDARESSVGEVRHPNPHDRGELTLALPIGVVGAMSPEELQKKTEEVIQEEMAYQKEQNASSAPTTPIVETGGMPIPDVKMLDDDEGMKLIGSRISGKQARDFNRMSGEMIVRGEWKTPTIEPESEYQKGEEIKKPETYNEPPPAPVTINKNNDVSVERALDTQDWSESAKRTAHEVDAAILEEALVKSKELQKKKQAELDAGDAEMIRDSLQRPHVDGVITQVSSHEAAPQQPPPRIQEGNPNILKKDLGYGDADVDWDLVRATAKLNELGLLTASKLQRVPVPSEMESFTRLREVIWYFMDLGLTDVRDMAILARWLRPQNSLLSRLAIDSFDNRIAAAFAVAKSERGAKAVVPASTTEIRTESLSELRERLINLQKIGSALSPEELLEVLIRMLSQ